MKEPKKRGLSLERDEKRLIKALGKRILEYASKRKVSIERLAYEAGVSKGYLYDLVKGNGNPSFVIMFRLASALDLPLSDLINFS